MRVERLAIPDVVLIEPKRFGDNRGFFSEVYSRPALIEAGIPADFVQDNHSKSEKVGTVRGLHFQVPPFAQHKLVRVTRGRILDIAVDIRRGSATYGRHVAVELSADNWRQLFVPIGFAHGFCTLEPDTEVLYKVSEVYAPKFDAGVIWNDPQIAINWSVRPEAVTLSEKDAMLGRLADLKSPFAIA